ncbi:hypothetical protein ABVT39_022915 [Epinephelus coioides]
MSEKHTADLPELLKLVIRSPSHVNILALHDLFQAIIGKLNAQEIKTQEGAPPSTQDQAQGGSTKQQLAPSPPKSRPPRPGGLKQARTRIKAPEDDMSMKMVVSDVEKSKRRMDALEETVRDLSDFVRVEIKALSDQQKTARAEMASDFEKCHHRMDALEETVRSEVEIFRAELKALHQQCTTAITEMVSGVDKCHHHWNGLEERFLKGTAQLHHQMEHLKAEMKALHHQHTTAVTEMASNVDKWHHHLNGLEERSLKETAQLHREMGHQKAEMKALHHRHTAAVTVMAANVEECHDRMNGLEKRSLKETAQLHCQMEHQKAEMKALHHQQTTAFTEMASNVEKCHQHMTSLEERSLKETAQIHCQMEHLTAEMKDLHHQHTTAFTEMASDVEKCHQHMTSLEETVRCLIERPPAPHYQQKTDDAHFSLGDRKLREKCGKLETRVTTLEKGKVELQAQTEKLHDTTRQLHDDNRKQQSQIEDLNKTKADKETVELEFKSQKCALAHKVSRLQLDSEHLHSTCDELLNNVTSQEQDWHKITNKLSAEMESKLNRGELDSVKQQLDSLGKTILEKLQVQEAPQDDIAAGTKQQLVNRSHCLSCDRSIVLKSKDEKVLPYLPRFPAPKSTRLQKDSAVMGRQVQSVQRRVNHSDSSSTFLPPIAMTNSNKDPVVKGPWRH